MLLDGARKKIYEGLGKLRWKDVTAEYSHPDSQLIKRLKAVGIELNQRALELIWDGKGLRAAGNSTAHEAPADDVRLGVTSYTGANREVLDTIYSFVYGFDAEI